MIRDLLFTDLDGTRLTEPETVIDGAADDPRYLERVPGLRAVLVDDSAERYHRWLALVTLTTWGHAPVYPVVVGTVEQGRRSPWHGMLEDAEGRDRTFPELAGAVAEGARFTSGDDEQSRREVVRAMIGRADELHFGWQLPYAADDPEHAPELAAVVERGLGRSDDAGFDRSVQLADLCAVLARHDRPRAVELAERLVRADPRTVVRTHLCAVVPFRA